MPDFPGAVAVAIEKSQGWEYRVALGIGLIGDSGPLIALLPQQALYGPDDLAPARVVRLADSVRGGSQYDGQILEIPTISVPETLSGRRTFYLSAAAFSPARADGVAACLGRIVVGEPATVLSFAPDAGPDDPAIALRARVERVQPFRVVLQLESAARPKLGEPVFVGESEPAIRAFSFPIAAPAPRPPSHPEVVGVVAELLADGRVGVATLPAIFHALPSETPAWALQPRGLCIDRRPTAAPGDAPPLQRFVADYLVPALKEVWTANQSQGGAGDAMRRLAAMRDRLAAGWPSVRTALTAPGVEQYYFDPKGSDQDQFARFLLSIAAAMGGPTARFRTALNAVGPVARLRAVKPGPAGTDHGWALAARVGNDGTLLLITALHLVAPDRRGREREIWIYPPDLQGVGLRAVRLPFVDRALDLAALMAEIPKKTAQELFRFTGAACAGTETGDVEIPVTVWGWHRASWRGRISPGRVINTAPSRPWATSWAIDSLNIEGSQLEPGLSGSALVQGGMFVAGLATGNLGPGRGGRGATLGAALRLLPPGPDMLRTSPDCPPRSIEERVVQAVRRHLLGQPSIQAPNRDDLRRLFGSTAAAVAPTRLPAFPTLADLRGVSSSHEQIESIRRAVMAGAVEARCASLRAAPPPPEEATLSLAQPWGQCDLQDFGQHGLKIRLEPPAPLPICDVVVRYQSKRFVAFGEPDAPYEAMVQFYPVAVTGERVWNAASVDHCHGGGDLVLYVPQGWVAETAAVAGPARALVPVTAGPVMVGGCTENKIGLAWTDCEPNVDALLKRVDTRAFWITRFPVTVAQYARCVAAAQCRYTLPKYNVFAAAWASSHRRLNCNWGQPERGRDPMNCVSWTEANSFCRASGGRLPTDAEWEKAVRGTAGPRHGILGNQPLQIHPREAGTMEVGLAPELHSPFGLEDVLWDVGEWTDSPYQDYAGQTLHHGKGERTIRGREFGDTESREPWSSDRQLEDVGFRCVYPLAEQTPIFIR